MTSRPGGVGAAIAGAAHIAAYTTVLIVLFVLTALCVGKLGFIVAWLLAPAIAARLAAITNRTVARRVVRHAIVGVVANGGTIGVLRTLGWPLFGVDSVELTTLLLGPVSVFVATAGVGLLTTEPPRERPT